MNVRTREIAPETVAFLTIAGLAAGWTGGSVLAGQPASDYVYFVPVILGAAVALYASRTSDSAD